jgi:chromosome partitioning protein
VTKASSGGDPASRTSRSRAAPDATTLSTPNRSTRAKLPRPDKIPGVARIIAIANQKGGVGKSTTAVSLGAALADLGYRVLVADLDPQGNASTGMGIRHDAREFTVYDVIVAEAPVQAATVPTQVDRLFAIPSTIDLAGAEIELVSQFSRESRLKKALDPIREGVYDFIFMDCPPSLGLLTINALTAAEELIVPIQCEYYALEGLGQLLRNVSLVQQNINPNLRLTGIVMTMFDPRTRLSEQVVAEVRRFFGGLVYDVIIPRTVRLSEAPGFGQPITVYDPKSKGAESYRELAREVALRPPPSEPMPVFDDLPSVVIAPMEDTVTRVSSDPSGSEAPQEAEELEEPQDGNAPGVQDAGEGVTEPSDAELEAQTWLEELAAEGDVEVPSTGDVLTDAVAEVVEQLHDEDHWEDAEEPRTREARVSVPRSPAPAGSLPTRRVVVIDDDPEAELTTLQGAAGINDEASDRPGIDDRRDNHGGGDNNGGGSDGIGARLENEVPTPKRRWRLFRKGGE